ncbi:hypothetical protein [Microbispora sp. H10670]|nr:hypothetical protein [Microbispora sp. H10670]
MRPLLRSARWDAAEAVRDDERGHVSEQPCDSHVRIVDEIGT